MLRKRCRPIRFTHLGYSFLLLCLLHGCSPVSFNQPRTVSHALYRPETTSLGRAVRAQAEHHPGTSGFYQLFSGEEALLARVFLIDRAEKTLDLQYFIFHPDLTGKYLLNRLVAAAERGVRVRLLIDDWQGSGVKDALFAALETSPNIEVRIFNPFGGRRSKFLARPLQMVFGPKRLRGRMHNKAFIADNSVAIMGGRNIGDEYFGASPGFNFQDLDLLAQGPLVRELSAAFDDYWNCALSAPIRALVSRPPAAGDFQALRQDLQRHRDSLQRSAYGIRLGQHDFQKRLEAGKLPFVWGPAELLSDEPLKCIDSQNRGRPIKMALKLQSLIEKAEDAVFMISPYFVPRKFGVRWFRKMRGRGVTMIVITNSLASTDAPQAQIGYMNYRKRLLWMGVDLYEIRPKPGQRTEDLARLGDDFLRLGISALQFGSSVVQLGGSDLQLSGPSRESLHAKTLVLDRRVLFVGSFNLDPRSVRFDTQNVVVIRSPELAAQAADLFALRILPSQTYLVKLREHNRLVWITEDKGRQVSYYREPEIKFLRLLLMRLIGILTPESVL